MCSLFRSGLLAALLCLIGKVDAAKSKLRVCADPNNLPFSNQAGAGFENKLAETLARDLGATLEYSWWPERKSAVNMSLDKHECDVLLGVPTALDTVLTTAPYYRSTYVFVSRADRHLNLVSLSDIRFSDWRIGIHIVGEDYAPPAHALARRGLSGNLIGYSLFGAEGIANPAAKLITAVEEGEVDVAIAWGPLAGYFAKSAKAHLDIVPVSPPMYLSVPFTYSISLGVRRDDVKRKSQLDALLFRECSAVDRILKEYGVPLIQGETSQCEALLSQRSARLH